MACGVRDLGLSEVVLEVECEVADVVQEPERPATPKWRACHLGE